MTEKFNPHVSPDIQAAMREKAWQEKLEANKNGINTGKYSLQQILEKQAIQIPATDMTTGEFKMYPRFVLRGLKHAIEGHRPAIIYFDGTKNYYALLHKLLKPSSIVHGLNLQIKKMKPYASHLIMYDNLREGQDAIIYEYVHGIGEQYNDKLKEYLTFNRI